MNIPRFWPTDGGVFGKGRKAVCILNGCQSNLLLQLPLISRLHDYKVEGSDFLISIAARSITHEVSILR